MKKLLLIFALTLATSSFGQAISVNTTTYTVPQLVNTVLINSPCVAASNITWKTGSQFNSVNGIGFFQNTNPAFPMRSGVLLSTGDVAHAAGPNTAMLSDGAATWSGDATLENTLAQAGIPMNSTNATALEFDFTPIAPNFSFDFLFASEEYGNFQCQFSDAFAFLLTNTLTGETVNLAVVPGTNLPISVVTIRDFLYNSSCPSQNAAYFGAYNGGSAAAQSAINFNGQTKLMNASAILIPNTPYHIKLVIADRGDAGSDSAIFIASDSFSIGQDVLGANLTVANQTALCFGTTTVLNSNLDASAYSFSWKKDGVTLAGQNGPTLQVSQAGEYSVTYIKPQAGCQPETDFITVEYYPEFTIPNPTNLYKCETDAATYTFDLSKNTVVVTAAIDPAIEPASVVSYYASVEDATNSTNALPLQFNTAAGTTVYVRVNNLETGCFAIKSFQLLTAPSPIVASAPDMIKCARTLLQNNNVFSFSTQNAAILGTQSSSLNTISYYISQADADAGINPLPTNGYTAPTNTVIYVRIQNISDNACYSIGNFTIIVNPLPAVDVLPNVLVCTSYTLPALTNGSYFSNNAGTLVPLAVGTVITETQTVYIFNQPDGPEGCKSGSSFKVTVIDPNTITPASGTFCGNYTLPTLSYGNYYTQTNGGGTRLNAGSVITSSQTIHVFYQSLVAPFCQISTNFTVNIVPKPEIPTLPNVFDCTSYTLPALANGNYYTEANGGGTQLAAGTVITQTQTIYIYATTGAPNNCVSQTLFKVFIGFTAPANVLQCNPYTLPALPIGSYYTGANGTGTELPAGTVISTPRRVYIHIPSAGNAACIQNLNFSVIVSQPVIDQMDDVTVCESYTLPTLTSGAYYGGIAGTGIRYYAGDVITSTKTLYIFKRSSPTCFNQDSFTITIAPKPLIDSRSDIDICNSYTLTPLTNGNYYTGPNGTGTQLAAGTVITQTQTIYIYATTASAPFCSVENSFTITIFSITADAPSDVTKCDSYTLPALTNGNYYTGPNGPHNPSNTQLHAGDVLTASATLYVYIESGARINCTDENVFTVTVNPTPVVAPKADEKVCNAYILPTLAVGNYFSGPNGTGTAYLAGDAITSSQTVYIYAQTNSVPNCTDEKEFHVDVFNVDELPNVTTCESFVLPTLTVGNYYTGPNGSGIRMFPGHTISHTQTVYIYAQSPYLTSACYDQSSFIVTIIDTPVAYPVSTAQTTICDADAINDGNTQFDLTTLNASILGSQIGEEFMVTYYASFNDAAAGINAITSTDLHTVYVKVSNNLTTTCFDIKAINITVNKAPESFATNGTVCFDSNTNTLLSSYTITSGLNSATHTFEWYNEAGDLLGTQGNYIVETPGNYTLVVKSTLTGCFSQPKVISVLPSMPATISYEVSDAFDANQVITVTAVGVGGDYEYQLDNGAFQDSNVFDNVSSGTHIITVRDKNGCGQTYSEALLVNYPKFFTPNGDGFNDTWNIVDLQAQSTALIHIFDRYGRLLKDITPNGAGWDGRFGGEVLPADDYWFTITYTEDGINKVFKAHFSLKR
ncbi:MAG: T9SS type B sorting domain-containing protein [Flavobacterium sp.]|nr:T9SS type B sorting domain-containing protein [Flavobacterium sp.]